MVLSFLRRHCVFHRAIFCGARRSVGILPAQAWVSPEARGACVLTDKIARATQPSTIIAHRRQGMMVPAGTPVGGRNILDCWSFSSLVRDMIHMHGERRIHAKTVGETVRNGQNKLPRFVF